MLTKGMSKSEIEKELKGKGDFIQIDYLNRFIAQKPPLHEKKFAFIRLIDIYNSKKMFNDVAKIYNNLSLLALSPQEKLDYLVKETKAHIQGGRFDEADSVMRRAMEEVPIIRKTEIYEDIKNFYKQQADQYEKESKRNHSAKVYEKILTMKITEQEKAEVKSKLLSLYDQLGKFKESSVLNNRRLG